MDLTEAVKRRLKVLATWTRAKKQDQFHNQIKSNFTGAGLTEEQGFIPNRSQEGPTRWHLHLNQGMEQEGGQARHLEGD